MKTFKAFRRGEIQFLATSNGIGAISIVDESGANYGSWQSLTSFESFAKQQGGYETLKIGRAYPIIRNCREQDNPQILPTEQESA